MRIIIIILKAAPCQQRKFVHNTKIGCQSHYYVLNRLPYKTYYKADKIFIFLFISYSSEVAFYGSYQLHVVVNDVKNVVTVVFVEDLLL